jgi:hypothetical protein
MTDAGLLRSLLPSDWIVITEGCYYRWMRPGHERITLLSPVGVYMWVVTEPETDWATVETGGRSQSVLLADPLDAARDAILAMHRGAVDDAGNITATVRSRADD